MIRTLRTLAPAAAMAAALAFAQQGPMGPGGNPNAPRGAGAGLDMARQQTIEGAITSVQIAAAAQYPSIVVGQTTVKVAPVWYLLDKDFELTAGETVKVVAAPSVREDMGLHAISITKTKTGAAIALRDEAGMPLWMRRGGGTNGSGPNGNGFTGGNGPNPQGPVNGGGCLDPASIASVSGVVDGVNAGLGIQHPTLTLKADGKLMTFKLGPERVLLEADFELKAGMALTVKYGLATCSEELLALTLTDADGKTLVIRTDDGRPAWF